MPKGMKRKKDLLENVVKTLRITPSGYDLILIPCDTKEWIHDHYTQHKTNHGTNSMACLTPKGRLDALVRKKLSRKEISVSSVILHSIPTQLRDLPFQGVLDRFDLPAPWDSTKIHNFEMLIPDQAPIALEKFISEFVFVLVLWWTKSDNETLYVTLEAEHIEGTAQCTYGIPENDPLCKDIVSIVFETTIPLFEAPF